VSILKNEPVRTAVYSVAVAVLAIGVAAGVIDDATSAWISGIAAVVLGGATEAARSVVTPVAKMKQEQQLS
jgi:hypothetical protein